MQVEEELALAAPDQDTLLTIGVFDGVHLGHRHLIAELVKQAEQQGLLPGVVTFRQHPQELVSPRTKLSFLTNIDERISLLKDEGVRLVVALPFTEDLARLSARQFISLLQKHLRMRGLVIGPDFALGRDREGNVGALRKLGQQMRFSVAVVPPAMIDGEVVSSTAIRKALTEGDVRKAYRLAGRPFSLSGSVVAGARRGTELGFPTANLDTNSHQALPADGVYAGWARIDDKKYPSLTNVRKCPTFGGIERRVEVYILDYHGDLYGRQLKVDFLERLRDERRFSTIDELKEQMAEDARRGKAILDSEGGD